MSITLAQLRAFVQTLELGTFTAAADELGVTQASISELIFRLEEYLGASLFVRGGRRLVPTPAAIELQKHAWRALQATEDAQHAIRALNSLESGVATFGVPRNANYYGLSELVSTFHVAHPNVKVRMVGLNSHDVADAVSAGNLEAGLVVLPVMASGLDYTPLFEDEVLYATSGKPPEEGLATVNDLTNAGLVLYDAHSSWVDPTRRQLQERAQAQGILLDPIIEVEQVESALSLVAAGIGATIVSDSIRRKGKIPTDVNVYPFQENFTETIALITRSDFEVSRATQEIIRLVRKTIERPPEARIF
jgi:DNA-binding transcriptional LysR family regulator